MRSNKMKIKCCSGKSLFINQQMQKVTHIHTYPCKYVFKKLLATAICPSSAHEKYLKISEDNFYCVVYTHLSLNSLIIDVFRIRIAHTHTHINSYYTSYSVKIQNRKTLPACHHWYRTTFCPSYYSNKFLKCNFPLACNSLQFSPNLSTHYSFTTPSCGYALCSSRFSKCQMSCVGITNRINNVYSHRLIIVQYFFKPLAHIYAHLLRVL